MNNVQQAPLNRECLGGGGGGGTYCNTVIDMMPDYQHVDKQRL